MLNARRSISVVMAAAAVISVGIGLMIFSSSGLIDETVAHSRKIDMTFQDAARYVGAWKSLNDRLPTSREFEAWAATQASQPYGAQHVLYSVQNFPDEVIAQFGEPAGEAYLLTFWRGEWNEYYASWADRSSLSHDPAEYSILGSRWRDLFAFGAAGVFLAFVAVGTWPPNPRVQRTHSRVTSRA